MPMARQVQRQLHRFFRGVGDMEIRIGRRIMCSTNLSTGSPALQADDRHAVFQRQGNLRKSSPASRNGDRGVPRKGDGKIPALSDTGMDRRGEVVVGP